MLYSWYNYLKLFQKPIFVIASKLILLKRIGVVVVVDWVGTTKEKAEKKIELINGHFKNY